MRVSNIIVFDSKIHIPKNLKVGFVNLTNPDFSKAETKLLEKGFKHNMQNNNVKSLEM